MPSVTARDLFLKLVVDPSFYGSVGAAKKEIEHWKGEAASGSLSNEDRINVELALVRVERVRHMTDLIAATAKLNKMTSEVNADLLSIKHRIVRAECRMYDKGEFWQLKDEFESIACLLNRDHHDLLYALVAIDLSVVHATLGNMTVAEDYCQDALSISRAMGIPVQQAYALNNYAVLKKNLAQYSESEHLLKKAMVLFKSIGAVEGQTYVYNNLAVLRLRIGDWPAADYYLDKAIAIRREAEAQTLNHTLTVSADVNRLHLYLMQRRFSEAIDLARAIETSPRPRSLRISALLEEFLAEAFFETGDEAAAEEHLAKARDVTAKIAPGSNVMTEILRRQAQIDLFRVDTQSARREALSCIRLCRRIGDHYEMGAAYRVLAQAYAGSDRPVKAVNAFEASLRILKQINESYERMRTCVAYAEFLIATEHDEPDIYLLEARSLCKTLGLEFYLARIALLAAKHALNAGDFGASRNQLINAETIADKLAPCDRKKLKPQIRKLYKELDEAILKSSVESAKKLRSIGKLYEDARFPIEELKPEMATEVAVNAGASQLFLIRKKNKGFAVPLKYNISADEAKRTARFQLRTNEMFFQAKDPTITPLPTGKTLVCVPGPGSDGYVLCTIFEGEKRLEPRDLELLFASVEAMERVAEEYNEVPPYVDVEGFLETGSDRLVHPGGNFKDILTLDPEMIKIIHMAERASETNVPILLEGETGVGKELFARAIHAQSPREHKQFIAMNAGGVPLNLLESQLFGHVKGAFTDAVTDRHGLIEEAQGGTLFLDEIGEMSEELQVKLLRLLENGEYRRLGENRVRIANVRVVSATNKDLALRVKEGLFREDLFYRLATVKLHLPPLRSRKRDIEFLVRHFMTDGLVSIGKPRRRINVDLKALEAFELYHWPGNVRELKNEIMRVLSLIGQGDLIRFGMLSGHIKAEFTSVSEDGGILTRRVDRYERRLILKALEDNEWNRIKTAEQIGIPRTTLLFKMKRLNIAP